MAIGIGLVKMLLELQHTRKTGALDVAGPGARVRLFVEDGQVVFADEGTVGETLGRILVREHVLTQEQYAAAIESMTGLRAAGKRAKLGEVFIQLGLLSVQQVHAALSAQVQQKVMRAIGWGNATLWFVESLGALEVADRFETAVEPLIVSALRLADRERIDELLAQARDRYPALRGDRESGGGSTKLATIARINAFRLSGLEDAFARTLDGTRPVRELVGDAELPGVDRRVILAALLLTDALDLHSTPIVPRSVGVPRPAPQSSQKLLSAAAAAATPTPPPVPVAAAAPAANARPASEPEMTRLLAENAFQNGRKLVRTHRLTEAVAELRRAASLHAATEYGLWAAWAAARADVRGEDVHAAGLRAIAEIAIEQDTERGFATYVLGHLARRAGDNARAEELFARARSIDPEVAEVEGFAPASASASAFTPMPASSRPRSRPVAPELPPPSGPTKEPRLAAATWDTHHANAERKDEANAKAAARAKPTANANAKPDANARDAEPSTGPPRRLLAGMIVASLTAAVVLIATRPSTPDATSPALTSSAPPPADSAMSATRSAPPSVLVSPAASASALASPPASPPAAASYAPPSADLPTLDAAHGRLDLPRAADGHRVFVDGRLAGVPPTQIVVACGRRLVKVGSQGREQTLVVPCGSSLSVAYP